MADNNDNRVVQIETVVGLYLWAVEQASRPDYLSPAQAVVMSQVQGRGRSRYGPMDYRDHALSIIGAVAGISEPFPRDTFRFVYGCGIGAHPSLSSVVARKLLERGSTKDYSKLFRLCEITTLRVKRQRYKGLKTPLRYYSERLGLDRSSLYTGGWMDLIDSSQDIFEDALERGTDLAHQALGDRGLI